MARLTTADNERASKWTGNYHLQVQYDPQEHLIAIFSRWHGTVLPLVLKKYIFWTILGLHVLLLELNERVELPAMDVSVLIGLPASLLIFLVVFYNGNCYERFFEMWRLTADINALVNTWVLQVSFTFEELSEERGLDHDADLDIAKGGNNAARTSMSVDDAMWTAARRMLASQQMLFMALDTGVSPDCRDYLGRPTRQPNLMLGDGIDDEEYNILKDQGLLTDDEILRIRMYAGLKCQLPIKWALCELRALCTPKDRVENRSKNYEAMQEVAAGFNETAVRIVTRMRQPVPFMYFHILQVMMLIVNGLIAYEMVNIFADISWWLSIFTLAVISAMLLGLQEIACAMSDPFGSDYTDFDTHTICFDAYRNAVSYLAAHQPSDLATDTPIRNPITRRRRADAAAMMQSSPSACSSSSPIDAQLQMCPSPRRALSTRMLYGSLPNRLPAAAELPRPGPRSAAESDAASVADGVAVGDGPPEANDGQHGTTISA